MPMDPAIADALNAQLLSVTNNSAGLVQVIDKNLTQGLGVVNTTLIQQHGGVADDPPIMSGQNTAAGVPQSGYVKGT